MHTIYYASKEFNNGFKKAEIKKTADALYVIKTWIESGVNNNNVKIQNTENQSLAFHIANKFLN